MYHKIMIHFKLKMFNKFIKKYNLINKLKIYKGVL